ncbi:acyl-CoA thioesterase [Candidatus Binatia bacterium]|nr:acyl-CoA thioesterase [Candidatus Binatia bacterium]
MTETRFIEVARYRVICGDCDPMRIMYNGTYLRLFEIGWTELLRVMGTPLAEFVAQGRYLAVVDVQCRYLRPARYDDVVVIRAAMPGVSAARLEIQYELVREDGEMLAGGRTVHAIVDDDGRPHRIPEAVRAAARRFAAD